MASPFKKAIAPFPAPLKFQFTTPAELFPVTDISPAPFFVTSPAPEIVFDTVNAFDRLKINSAPVETVTAPLPRLPVAPPFPISRTPPETVVAPEKVFAVVRIKVPAFDFVNVAFPASDPPENV